MSKEKGSKKEIDQKDLVEKKVKEDEKYAEKDPRIHAFEVVKAGLEHANKKGAFSMDEVVYIREALYQLKR
jgi:hypothetical protein